MITISNINNEKFLCASLNERGNGEKQLNYFFSDSPKSKKVLFKTKEESFPILRIFTRTNPNKTFNVFKEGKWIGTIQKEIFTKRK
jgi:hypothetical protein